MSGHRGYEDMDERAIELLLAPLADMTAPEELKERTLAAVFAEMGDEEQGEDAPDSSGDSPSAHDDAHGAPDVERVSVGADEMRASQEEHDVAGHARSARGGAWRLRVAAGLLVLALGCGGAIAYAVPVSHLMVEADGATFDIGVNVFGMAVSAEADSEDGKAALQDADVHHMRMEDALGRILDAYDKRRGGDKQEASVWAQGSFAGSAERLTESATGLLREQGRYGASGAQDEEETAHDGGSGGERTTQEQQGERARGQEAPQQSQDAEHQRDDASAQRENGNTGQGELRQQHDEQRETQERDQQGQRQDWAQQEQQAPTQEVQQDSGQKEQRELHVQGEQGHDDQGPQGQQAQPGGTIELSEAR